MANFEFSLTRWCPPLSLEIERAAQDSNTKIVLMGQSYGNGHAYSTNPLFTSQVFNCNVVVLFGDNSGGMYHYSSCRVEPEIYLPRFIDDFKERSQTDNLEGVIVGGDLLDYESMKAILTQRGVPLVAEFCDNFPTLLRSEFGVVILYYLTTGREPLSYEGLAAELGEKFVLAIPSKREVWLYSTATDVGSRLLTRHITRV